MENKEIRQHTAPILQNQSIINRWTKGFILPFSKKGDLGIAKNYQITLSSITAKIYNALLLTHIEPEIEKNSFEEVKWVSEKSIHDITNFDHPLNLFEQKTLKQHYYL